MIAIIDYGMGNLRSVQKALEHVGAQAVVTSDLETILGASAVVLPGVGAFGDAMMNLKRLGLVQVIKEVVAQDRPTLGICLGLQLLFEESEERGQHPGLGIFPGRVVRFRVSSWVPHIGWNGIHIQRPSPLLAGIEDGAFAYFVHSYYAEPTDRELVLATTDYEVDFPSVVGRGNLFGIQFHPEKSQEVGLKILANFARMSQDVGDTGR